MGNCCTMPPSHTSKEAQEGSGLEGVENWNLGNQSFDYIVYHRSTQSEEVLSFQRILQKVWREVDLQALPHSSRNSKYNSENSRVLRRHIHKGVPNYKVKEVILCLLSFDEEASEVSFNSLKEGIESMPDFSHILPTQDPLFGRKDLSNCYLNPTGTEIAKRILYIAKHNLKDFQVCFVLPRVVQMLLWFFKEHEVYQIIAILLEESKKREEMGSLSMHFPLTLQANKRVISIARHNLIELYQITEDYTKQVLKDMLQNMLIGYISPSFYPLVLCYFIADGMVGLMKLSIALIGQIRYKVHDGQVKRWRQLAVKYTDMQTLLKQANKIKIKYEQADTVSGTLHDFNHYSPVFEDSSVILSNKKLVEDLCSVVPKHFWGLKFKSLFSLGNFGYDIKELTRKIKGILGAWVILFQSKKQRVFGVFFDRPIGEIQGESKSDIAIFTLHPHFQRYPHQNGKAISCSIGLQSGLIVTGLYGISSENILIISPSLHDAVSFPSEEFKSPALHKQASFQIYNLEVYELIA